MRERELLSAHEVRHLGRRPSRRPGVVVVVRYSSSPSPQRKHHKGDGAALRPAPLLFPLIDTTRHTRGRARAAVGACVLGVSCLPSHDVFAPHSFRTLHQGMGVSHVALSPGAPALPSAVGAPGGRRGATARPNCYRIPRPCARLSPTPCHPGPLTACARTPPSACLVSRRLAAQSLSLQQS